MKNELLAPAGDFASLKSAINNGADAIYLAGKSYGARKYASNFTNEELIEAINYAHLYGVKIYVTVNTLIKEKELEECLNYINFLYNINVDAIIVQDIGLIKLVRETIPKMEIHASTQAHTHNINQIKLLENLGVKRVVLARELSLNEINNLNTTMELEVFIHGALCISYSGECLFSSFLLGRSGNRGECAGLCRLPYNLLKDNKIIASNKYLLSPKELNTTNYFEELKASKIYSFKIEGRMKSPEYVGYVTHLYRKLLDNPNYKLSNDEIFNLKSLYNRGFTKGYLFNNTASEFISLNSSNHQGVKVGEVIGFTKDKIKIKLTHEINQEDAIRLPDGSGMYLNFLYDKNLKLVNKCKENDIAYIDNKTNLKTKGPVNLTLNKKLIASIKNTSSKKIKVNCEVKLSLNNLYITLTDGINTVIYQGPEGDIAKKSPLTKERIESVMSRLNDTPFVLDKVKINLEDEVFIPIGHLNEIRRNLVNNLISKRIGVKKDNELTFNLHNKNNLLKSKLKISVLARTEEQIKALLDLNVDYIYITNNQLYKKYKRPNIYLRLDHVKENHESYQNENLLIGETGSIIYSKNNNVISDYYLNVVNSYYVSYLQSEGIKRITISPELNIDEISALAQNTNIPLEIIGYGTLEYMIMKYKMDLDNNNYFLENKDKRKFLIITDKYTHLMSDKKLDYIDSIPKFIKLGISTFRLELLDENSIEIKKIITKIKNYLN